MRRPVSVLVYTAVRLQSEWTYLLLHRVPLPELGVPSFWQGVTGGLKENESPEQAARREFLEETGIALPQVHAAGFTCRIPMQESWRHLYPEGVREIVEHVFVARLSMIQEPVLSIEHDASKWCGKSEALQLLLYENNIEALQRCDAFLDHLYGTSGQ